MVVIKNSSWAADKLPSGIVLDKDTGVISGTPVNAGEYTVPVSVTTEWGSDTKEVDITVRNAGLVLTRGALAEIWGGNGEETEDGLFRVLSMPQAEYLDPMLVGFGAKTIDGDYYVCGNYDVGQDTDSETWVNTPTPIKTDFIHITQTIKNNEILHMSSGLARLADSTTAAGVSINYNYRNNYIAIQRSNGLVYLKSGRGFFEQSSSAGYYEGKAPGFGDFNTAYNCKVLQSTPGLESVAWIESSHRNITLYRAALRVNQLAGSQDLDGLKQKIYSGAYYGRAPMYYMYKTSDNKIKIQNSSYDPDILGAIKDFWGSAFVLNENNELYAIGTSTNGCLGLSPTGGDAGGNYYSAYTKVGDFDVKEIKQYNNSTFLLTNDGKLYHAGLDEKITGEQAHYEFTRVFPDYRFLDIAYSAGTLVAIMGRVIPMIEYGEDNNTDKTQSANYAPVINYSSVTVPVSYTEQFKEYFYIGQNAANAKVNADLGINSVKWSIVGNSSEKDDAEGWFLNATMQDDTLGIVKIEGLVNQDTTRSITLNIRCENDYGVCETPITFSFMGYIA